MPICSLCKTDKEAKDFSPKKHKGVIIGLNYRCKACNAQASRESYAKNREAIRQRRKAKKDAERLAFLESREPILVDLPPFDA